MRGRRVVVGKTAGWREDDVPSQVEQPQPDLVVAIDALATLSALFDRLGRHEPVATLGGFGANPLIEATNPRTPDMEPVTVR